ncbi:MAG: ABC transporter permease [Candidatus Wallbacteria bacterium]|nr:ABC transporter permease [Candidatus Wallbacteria bacterium]
MKFFPLVFKNIRRNKRGTALTLGSIFVSLFLFTVLFNGVDSMDRIEHRSDHSLRICVHHKISLTIALPESYRRKLAALPGILAVCPFNWYGGVYRDPKLMFTTLSVDPETLLDVWGDQFEIPPEQFEKFKKTRTGAIVGRVTADKFGWKVGDHIQLTGTVFPVNLEFEICAIPTKDFDPRSLLLQRKYLEESLGNPGIATDFWCRVDKAEAIPGLMQQIDRMFANSQYETLTETEKSFAANMMGMFGDIRSVVGGVGLIVVLTIILVSANSVAMSVRERTTEMAVLKAIGFRPRHVMAMVMGEAMLVAFAGGMTGCLTAFWLFRSPWLAAKMGPMGALFVARPSVLGMGAGVALGVGALSGLVPAVSAARLRIVDALRQVA